MPDAISPADVMNQRDEIVLIDVRKQPARDRSGLAASGSVHHRPFAADSWWAEFAGKRVVVYCVLGHEVSQAVCGFIADQGIEAAYLDAGFAGWQTAGLPVEPIR